MLVYKVMKEGLVVVEVIVGKFVEQDVVVIFGVVYINFEFVWVGLIEVEVQEKGYEVKIGVFFMSVLGCVMML